MGPWGQAEGLSEPSLVLERCLERKEKPLALQCVPVLPCCPLWGWGQLCARCLQCLFEGSCPVTGVSHSETLLFGHRMGLGTWWRALENF